MINGWNYLALVHGLISALFIGILLFGEPNMFAFPVALVFVMATIYSAMQYYANRLIKKLENR